MMITVSNSTPLIALSRINKFGLLREYFGEVYIPKEVYEEVVTRGGNLFGAAEVASGGRLATHFVILSPMGEESLFRLFASLRVTFFSS